MLCCRAELVLTNVSALPRGPFFQPTAQRRHSLHSRSSDQQHPGSGPINAHLFVCDFVFCTLQAFRQLGSRQKELQLPILAVHGTVDHTTSIQVCQWWHFAA